MGVMKKILILIVISMCFALVSCMMPPQEEEVVSEQVCVPSFFRGSWNGKSGTMEVQEKSVRLGSSDLLMPIVYGVQKGDLIVRQTDETEGEDRIYTLEAWEKGMPSPYSTVRLLVHGGLRLTVTSTVLGSVTEIGPFYNI